MYSCCKRLHFIWAACLLLAVPLSASAPGVNPVHVPKGSSRVFRLDRGGAPKYVPGQVLVRFRPGTSPGSIKGAHSAIGAKVLRRPQLVDRWEQIRLPEGLSVEDAIRSYRRNPDVLYAEPNYIVHPLAEPNDPDFSSLWGLHNTGQEGGTPDADIDAPEAWDLTTGSPDVVVAVLDSGIDYTHEDLAANLWRNEAECGGQSGVDDDGNGYTDDCYGIDTANLDSDPMDDLGHGTHVAGIIGAVGNNAVGVSGVNWNVKLLPCKFINAYGGGDIAGAIACLDYVRALKDRGVNVVATNNSWGLWYYTQSLVDAIEAHRQHGILFVAAAGNEFSDNDVWPAYPANLYLPNVISVAATTRTDDTATFSNLGRHTVHLGAPGRDILSTTPNNTYSVFSGTSMATPFVTGVAALLKAQNSTLDWRGIKNLILAGGDTIPSLADTVSGKRLNAYGAMTCANSTLEGRLVPVPSTIAGAVGTPINLAVLNINCAAPNGSEQVTVSPGGSTITLLDDGNAPDQAAGDGIYSGQWTPPALGSYSLAFPGGDNVAVEVLNTYTASQVAASDYNYRSITGTNLDLADDSVAQITSPFPISYGGGSFSNLFVSSNGTLSLTDVFGQFGNYIMPIRVPYSQVVTLVAPFWEDLYPIPGTSQNVFWEVEGTAPDRELVVEWRDVRSFDCREDSTATVKFQVVFFESSGNVLFNYADTTFGGDCSDEDRGAMATVGIQVAPGVGTQWSYDEQDVGDGMGILWQPAGAAPPSNPVPTLSSFSPAAALAGSPNLALTVNGSNFIPGARVQWNYNDRLTSFVSSTQVVALIPASDLAYGTTANVTVVNPSPGGGNSNYMMYTVKNVVPTITSLSPSSVPPGAFSFRLTVNGTGFTPLATNVYWNGQQRTTVWVSPTQVVGFIVASDVANTGTASVTVVNDAPGGGTSAPAAFTITASAPQPSAVTAPATQPVSSGGNSTGANGSGSTSTSSPSSTNPQAFKFPYRFLGWSQASRAGVDYFRRFLRSHHGLAIPVQNPSSPTGLISGLGTGHTEQALATIPPSPGFLFRNKLPGGFVPTGVATGDFNRDGKMDWVVSNGGSNDLWFYFGNGDGTSQLPVIIPLAGQSPVWVTAADLRGIGILDLVVAEADSQTIGVLLGNGDGTFGQETTYFVPGPPLCLLVNDFNGDGHPDILAGIAGSDRTGGLVVLPGDGTGRFGRPVFRGNPSVSGLFLEPVILDMASADLNGDGLPDLVVNDVGSIPSEIEPGVFSYLNQGDSTFKPSQLGASPIPGAGFTNVALGDLNGDGCADLVILNTFGLVGRAFGNCDGTFQNGDTYAWFGTGEVGYGLALADVNGDGHLDVVSSGIVAGINPAGVGWQTGKLVSVLLGDGKGGFSSPRVYRGEPSMFSLAVADVNGDGHPDIITANQDTDSVSVYLNDGQGGFGSPQGGYNGYIMNGSGGATNAPFPLTGLVAKDLNGDGATDLAVLEVGSVAPLPYGIAVVPNNGNGVFSPALHSGALEESYARPGDYALADFRNTGRPDLLVVGEGQQVTSGAAALSFASNNGDGTFAHPMETKPPGAQGTLGVGDFNGDGKLDFVAVQGIGGTGSNGTTGQLSVFLGNGAGGFTPGFSTTFTTTSSMDHPRVQVGDFNHDEKLDVLVQTGSDWGGTSGRQVLEFLGNGDATFSAPRVVLSDFGPFSMGDLNHDGLADIVELVEPTTTMPLGLPVQIAIYLGQPDGSFKLANTYQPYAGQFNMTQFDLGPPLLGDFNGDGNLDVVAFQTPPGIYFGGFEPCGYFQILAGNGDGTFTPTYTTFDLTTLSAPQYVAEVNGDGRADLIELDGYASSYHVIPASPGPAMQIHLVSNPVIGSNGKVQINLAVASSSSTIIGLAASDPAITVPASISIPAGSVTQVVPFQIGSTFNPNHVFSIQAQLGTETETAYGTQATNLVGFRVFLGNNPPLSIVPSQTTADYLPQVYSVDGYSTTLQLQCQGLPAGATCQFGNTSLPLPAGGVAQTSLTVATTASLAPGSYAFTVVASDSSTSSQLTATLNVGDFTISISPATIVTNPSNFANFTLTVGAVNGFQGTINFGDSGLPAGATITNLPSFGTVSTYDLTIQTQSVPNGNYQFTITGTAGSISHSASATLQVQAPPAPPDFSGSVAPTSATLSVGQSANFSITLNSQNGATGTVTFQCLNVPNGSTCSFNPSAPTLPANGSISDNLTVQVNTRPTAVPPEIRSPWIAPSSQPQMVLPLAFAVIAALLSGMLTPRRKLRLAASLLLLIGVASYIFATASCGGGGGGSSPPPPPLPVTFTITVQASVSGINATKTLGTLTITVN
jgi:hypothetical protein